ncbi:hypothetical protein B0H13DRAFT_1914978 [Mycena leptocephala]|nr:hypothetical protein B0H13DRAFT_1914978 [Mycena leptocephala]
MPQSYQLHIISVSGIQWKPHLLSLHRETPNLYVEIDVGGKKVYRSSAKRTWAGMWNDISSLPTVGKAKCLAKTEREIDFQLQLDHADEDLKQVSKPELVDSATLHSAGAVAGSVASLVDHGAQHGDLLSALGTLVVRLGNVVEIGAKIGGEIAKIHPYSHAAWKVLTSVYEVAAAVWPSRNNYVQLTRHISWSRAQPLKPTAIVC